MEPKNDSIKGGSQDKSAESGQSNEKKESESQPEVMQKAKVLSIKSPRTNLVVKMPEELLDLIRQDPSSLKKFKVVIDPRRRNNFYALLRQTNSFGKICSKKNFRFDPKAVLTIILRLSRHREYSAGPQQLARSPPVEN